MAKIGRFTNDKAEAAFLRAYDAISARWPVPYTDLDIETSFGTTRVRKSGSGDHAPLVLLSGMPGNCLFWQPFIEELARDRVVYALDIMGWPGRCRQTAPIRDQDDIIGWLAETLDGLGVDRVHLAGYSVGAWLAALVGTKHSDRLASLSMLEPGGATFAKPKWSLLLKLLAAGLWPTDRRMRKIAALLTPSVALDDEAWAMAKAGRKFRLALPWERPLTDDQLRALTAPLLVLFARDTVVNDPEIGARRLRDHVPSADVETYPDVGHDLLWARTDTVIPRFLAFAAKHEPART
ncbi:alpha/beta fold hydrolase [Nocardia puris]|uniref:Pimeloyl-ACP methyl ester carboxylesterase n=1 Tax=Nocardia puris TaxID=208602 RepID=A0A366DR10_9NOCA|nr:alpha/beta hydrolase [Nocardia puris]MBF6210982.1 alpha/beta fold hydrolase [Nocardia puris]MBF6364578.1 alpha/beta fold hydrolase [Nocardia puris]MBF6459507.1 alpha/beta fold hydrolase [Nocardia puris]RBO92531.1 pimeloyl-ACP methyl ester carboxylesterase [Nocardia puris]